MIRLLIALAVVAGCSSPAPVSTASGPVPSAAGSLAAARPESIGVRSGPLADMIEHALAQGKDEVNVHHVTVVRRRRTVLDVSFFPYTADVPHDVASVAKSVTSTLVGMAIDDGFIGGVDALVLPFFPDDAPAEPGDRLRWLTVGHLLTMTSGMCADFADGERQLGTMRTAPHAVRFALAQPFASEPGERFAYCSAASNVLAALVANAVGEPLDAYAERRLFGPLGIEDVVWPTDRQGVANGWGDVWESVLESGVDLLDPAFIGTAEAQRADVQFMLDQADEVIRRSNDQITPTLGDADFYGPDGRLRPEFEWYARFLRYVEGNAERAAEATDGLRAEIERQLAEP